MEIFFQWITCLLAFLNTEFRTENGTLILMTQDHHCEINSRTAVGFSHACQADKISAGLSVFFSLHSIPHTSAALVHCLSL